jgi:hypothetical protein
MVNFSVNLQLANPTKYKRMFEKFWATRSRYYTNKVPSPKGRRLQLPHRLRGLTQKQGFETLPSEKPLLAVGVNRSEITVKPFILN